MMAARPKLNKGKSVTLQGKSGCGEFTVTIKPVNGKIKDVLIKPDEEKPGGGCMCSQLDGYARLISLAVQADQPLEKIIKNLKNNRCSRPLDDGATSCGGAVADVLDEYLKEHKQHKE
jgi:hypothetical protein